MRALQRSRDRKLLGVAAGFADAFGMDRSLWRAVWAIGSIFMPPLILAYLILGLVLPSAPDGAGQPQGYTGDGRNGGHGGGPQGFTAPGGGGDGQTAHPPRPQPAPVKRLTKSRDRWLAGVAGGVGEYLDLDPVLVRLLFLASLFAGGTGILVYVILLIVMEEPGYRYPPYPPR